MRLSVSSSKRLWRCCTDYNLPGRSSSLTHCQQLLKDVNKGDLKRRDARRPPLLHRQGCMQEGISIFFLSNSSSHTASPYHTMCVLYATGNGNIQWATTTTFCVARHFFHRFSHGACPSNRHRRETFFLLSVMKLIYLTNAESTRVYRFFFVIFIPNEILGKKSYSLRHTYAYRGMAGVWV